MSQWDPDDDDLVDELPAPPRQEIPPADFELLVMAARTINGDFKEIDGEGCGNLTFPDGSTAHGWNPLRFSDDAFELAVRLRFTVEVFEATVACKGVIGMRDKGTLDEHRHELAREELGQDASAATRRAITRAAAQIIRGNRFLSEIS